MTNFFEMDPILSRMGKFEYIEGESSEIMVQEALKFIEKNKAKPTFSVIWYGSPSLPVQMRPCRPGRISRRKAWRPPRRDRGHGPERGHVATRLEGLGIEKDTLIWYTSDNGGLSTDPDSTGHLQGFKGSLHEGGIRVPAIIEWPGKIKPAITDFPASTMDIMPTLVDLLDLPEDSMLPVVDGESIAALFDGKSPRAIAPHSFHDQGHSPRRREPQTPENRKGQRCQVGPL